MPRKHEHQSHIHLPHNMLNNAQAYSRDFTGCTCIYTYIPERPGRTRGRETRAEDRRRTKRMSQRRISLHSNVVRWSEQQLSISDSSHHLSSPSVCHTSLCSSISLFSSTIAPIHVSRGKGIQTVFNPQKSFHRARM